MPDGVYILLSVWGLLSFVSVAIAVLDSFIEERSRIDAYRKYIRYTIDHREKFSFVGKLVVIPIYTLVGVLLPVPALTVIGPIFIFCWVMYQSFRLILFK